MIKNRGLRPAIKERAYCAFAVSYLEVRIYGQIKMVATVQRLQRCNGQGYGQGCNGLKHLSKRISKHECSKVYMNNCVSVKMLGKVNILSAIDAGYRRSIIKHNELVDRNRHALSRIINCIKFCSFINYL